MAATASLYEDTEVLAQFVELNRFDRTPALQIERLFVLILVHLLLDAGPITKV